MATADGSSAWYVRSIAKAAAAVGIVCDVVDLGDAASTEEIRTVLDRLGEDAAVHGIILQTPLPGGSTPPTWCRRSLRGRTSTARTPPAWAGSPRACRPSRRPPREAVLALLDHHGVALAGRHAVVVGRSTVVGKPAAHLLLDRNATVTICHSRTSDLAAITRQADVLVAAVGRPGLITPEHVAPEPS